MVPHAPNATPPPPPHDLAPPTTRALRTTPKAQAHDIPVAIRPRRPTGTQANAPSTPPPRPAHTTTPSARGAPPTPTTPQTTTPTRGRHTPATTRRRETTLTPRPPGAHHQPQHHDRPRTAQLAHRARTPPARPGTTPNRPACRLTHGTIGDLDNAPRTPPPPGSSAPTHPPPQPPPPAASSTPPHENAYIIPTPQPPTGAPVHGPLLPRPPRDTTSPNRSHASIDYPPPPAAAHTTTLTTRNKTRCRTSRANHHPHSRQPPCRETVPPSRGRAQRSAAICCSGSSQPIRAGTLVQAATLGKGVRDFLYNSFLYSARQDGPPCATPDGERPLPPRPRRPHLGAPNGLRATALSGTPSHSEWRRLAAPATTTPT